MNPYDFVRIDEKKPPQRQKPLWHHRLVGPNGQSLYAGHIEIDMSAEKPLFIADPRSVSTDPKRSAQFLQNQKGDYVIPGSSLKGMLRCLVETLGSGCMTLFDGHYEPERQDGRFIGYKAAYDAKIPKAFQHCNTNTDLCIACRIFGMLKERSEGVFLGKVNIGDAISYADTVRKHNAIFTAPLVEPKPHHRDFYLDEAQKYIAGRKYYFHHHHDQQLVTANGFVSFGRGVIANRHIQPLDDGTKFHFRIDFSNLTADEFAVLLLAITLEENMRHKIGYGKPLGLGSVHLLPTRLTLIDYSTRYTQAGAKSSKKELTGNDVLALRDELMQGFSRNQLVQIAMDDLRRIWRWPGDPNVNYYYPSKRDWFDTEDSYGKRIADTRNTP